MRLPSASPALGLACAGAVVLVVHALHYWPTWTDDAYISFRYAARLWAHGELTFNPGERVEGLTNLGWALLLAPASGGDLLGWSRLLGLGCGVGTLALLVGWCRDRGIGWPGTGCAVAILALNPWVAHWLVQGMETPGLLLALTLAWTRHAREVEGRGFGSALGMAAAPWMRPDGALAAMVVGAWHLLRAGGPRFHRKALASAGLVAASAAALVGVKLLAFGAIVPRTFHVKVRGDTEERGLAYLEAFLTRPDTLLPLLFGVGLLAALWRALRRDDRGLPALVALSSLLMVVAVGGDFMANFRLLVPAVPALCAAVAVAVDGVQRRLADDLELVVGAVALLLTSVALRPQVAVYRMDQLNQPPAAAGLAPRLGSEKAAGLPWQAPEWGQGLEGRMPFAAAWTLVHAPDDSAVAYTDIGLISWVNPAVQVVDLLGLTDAQMGGRKDGVAQWRYLKARLDWFIVDTEGGQWGSFSQQLAREPWSVVAGCHTIWVFENPSSRATPPSLSTLDARIDGVLARSPDHRELHGAVLAELARTGRDPSRVAALASRLRDQHGAAWWAEADWVRCAAGEAAACSPRVGQCGANVRWIDPAAKADPAGWPTPPRRRGRR